MTYDLLKHWNTLKESLTFYDDKFKQTPYENIEDKDAYQTARQMIEEMVCKGLEMENTYWPPTKISLGREIDNLNKAKFGNDEIPSIKGAKSLLFAQYVFLPHLKRSLNIEYGALVLALSNQIGIDIEGKKKKSANLIEKLEASIKEYITIHSKLNTQGVFSTQLVTQANKTKEEIKHMQPQFLN